LSIAASSTNNSPVAAIELRSISQEILAMSLNSFFTKERPLGPIDQTFFVDPTDATDVLELTEPISTAVRHKYTHIHGRKGSGKTAVLSLYKGLSNIDRRPGANHVAQKKERIEGLVVEIVTWQQFHEMIESVAESLLKAHKEKEPAGELPLLPEKVEQSWSECIWEQIFCEIYARYRRSTKEEPLKFDPDKLSAVIKYVEGIDLLDDPKERRRQELNVIKKAKVEVNSFLEENSIPCFVLFDSMEDYPVRNPTFLRVVGGFLRAIARFEIQCPRVNIVFALPEEVRPILFKQSSNKLKDFESNFELRWRPRDLLRMVAHRYRLFLREHDPDWYRHFYRLDLSQPRGGVCS
jgi:hypothetical protein